MVAGMDRAVCNEESPEGLKPPAVSSRLGTKLKNARRLNAQVGSEAAGLDARCCCGAGALTARIA